MTAVEFYFLAPNGDPIRDTEFEIQISQAGYNPSEPGVLMPRPVLATTDEFGKATVELLPSPMMLYVTAYDTESKAGLSFKFYVPEVAPGTVVRLQDLVVEGPVTEQDWSEVTLQTIVDAKVNALAAQIGAEEAQLAAETAESHGAASATQAQDHMTASGVSAANSKASETASMASEVASKASEVAATASKNAAGVSATNAANSAMASNASAVASGSYADVAVANAAAAFASKTAAGTSEANAGTSAAAALASKNAAGTSEANALASKNVASASATAASTSETNALASKNAAAGSEVNASTGAAEAAASAADALASKTAAAGSATTASTKAGEAAASQTGASTSAGTATTKAAEASASAAAALISKNDAATSAGSVGAAAATATAQAAEATNSANAAAISAGTALTKAGESATSAAEALVSKNTAVTSAGTASSKAGEAATSASNAAASEGAALASKNAAVTSAANAGASEAGVLANKNAAALSESNAATSATLAQKWAVQMGAPVSGGDYSAKYYAAAAAASAEGISGAVTSWVDLDGAITLAQAKGALSLGKVDVGLGNVNDTSDADKPVSTAQQTALDQKAAASSLDKVDNTADVDKPVSTAQATADALRVLKSGDSMSGALDGAAAVSLASAATTSVGAAASNDVTLTGVTNITSLGATTAGKWRRVTYTGAGLTLTHNATSLILPTGANIALAPGDVFEVVGLGANNWRCVAFTRASGKTPGLDQVSNLPQVVLQRAYAESATVTEISTVIPADDTIPQSTEGTQILSVAITPKSTTNRLRIRTAMFVGITQIYNSAVVSLFRNGQANALATIAGTYSIQDDDSTNIILEYEFVPATTSAVTISVRLGCAEASKGSVTLNGYTGIRLYGGAVKATLVVEEIAP